MFPIEQSAFLQALGRAIGNSLWQVAAVWLVYAATTSLFKLPASRKYQLASAASLAGFVWFAVSFLYYYIKAPVQLGYGSVYTFSGASENIDRSSFVNQVLYFYHSVLASLKSLSPYISCAYLLVFLLLGIRLVNGFRQVKFFATQGLGKVDVQWRLFVQHHAGILQIKQHVKVFTSHYVQSPLTMGFWKPIILLPIASLNNLNTQQVEAILLHELAHIHRHDYLVNIFVQIAEICLFFNPFMRLLLKQIRQERENSCDDYVLQFQYSATDYAKALLAIEKNNAATLLALSAKDNQSFQLLNRVKRMVAPQPHAFNYRQQLYMLLLLTIIGLGFTVIVPKPKIQTPLASSSQIYKSNLHKELPGATTPVAPPAAPAAFDLVKTIQGIQSFAENIDLKQIEEQGKVLGEKAEAIGKAYGEKIEKNIQPYITEVTRWADKFSENEEAIAKLESAAKNFENLQYNVGLKDVSHIDEYLAPAMQKLNEAMKTFPKLDVVIPRVNMPAEMKKAREEMKKAVTDANTQYKVQVESEVSKAFHQQQNQLSYAFSNDNTRDAKKSAGKSTSSATVATAYEKDNEYDYNDEMGNPNTSPIAKLKTGKAFTYTLKLPELAQFKNFAKNFHIEWNNPVEVKEKRNNCNAGKRVIVTNGNENIINLSGGLSDLDIDAEDIKTIDIQQQKRSKNGKEETFVIIRIIPSR